MVDIRTALLPKLVLTLEDALQDREFLLTRTGDGSVIIWKAANLDASPATIEQRLYEVLNLTLVSRVSSKGDEVILVGDIIKFPCVKWLLIPNPRETCFIIPPRQFPQCPESSIFQSNIG
jgi:hypothetical protein